MTKSGKRRMQLIFESPAARCSRGFLIWSDRCDQRRKRLQPSLMTGAFDYAITPA